MVKGGGEKLRKGAGNPTPTTNRRQGGNTREVWKNYGGDLEKVKVGSFQRGRIVAGALRCLMTTGAHGQIDSREH